MKWIISMGVPAITAIAAAWVYLDVFLATKRSKEALIGNFFISLPYWAFWIGVLIPFTIFMASLAWKHLEARHNRLVVLGVDFLLIVSALVVPELIIRACWK